MTTEQISYRDNLQNFIDTIKNSFVEQISFNIDANPTFDKKTIPFDFKYCHSIRILTSKESFEIQTSMTDSGFETFWILNSAAVQNYSQHQTINSNVKNIELKNGFDNYAFKIKIEFEKNKLMLYSGDIYDVAENKLAYKINDEMILAFENEKDAEIFEELINK